MNLISVILQASGAAPAAKGQSGYMNILFLVALVAIFYFMMLRPQQQRQKAIRKAREAMKPGDKVVTSGGIHGKIKELGEQTMLIEVSDGVRLRIDKNAVFASSADIQQQQQR